jgi:hypothetical protein
MNTLLVLTTGHTDVQLVSDGERRKLDGDTCGILHDAIKNRRWCIVDSPSGRSRRIVKELPDGDLNLCTPKLDAILAYFGARPPSSVLVLETTREDARDPRLAGTILEERLRTRGARTVRRVAFLTNTDELENSANPIDAVVRRSVIASLSEAVATSTASLTANDRVFIATTGGLAAANDVITELVRLHTVGGPIVTALEVPDRNRSDRNDEAVEEKFHPAAGLRARWHALSLIEKGNLLGAWGAVGHLNGQPGQGWVHVVRWLADFASSLPIAVDCDLPSVKDQRMAVRAAIRVEFALRAGDIPRAVHGTNAFFEAAFWDWIRRHDFHAEGISGTFESRFSRADGAKLGNRFKDGRINDFKEGVKAWLPVLARPHLTALCDAITDDVRNLRNDVAHNEPTPSLMNEASAKMRAAGLWSHTGTFLTQTLVRNALIELGVREPQQLVAELLNAARERLVSVPMALGT